MDLNPLITATFNGVFDHGHCVTPSYSYKIDGVFDGGTVDIGYISGGVFVKYTDITSVTSAAQGVITCGIGSSVAFRLSGATSPVIHLSVYIM